MKKRIALGFAAAAATVAMLVPVAGNAARRRLSSSTGPAVCTCSSDTRRTVPKTAPSCRRPSRLGRNVAAERPHRAFSRLLSPADPL